VELGVRLEFPCEPHVLDNMAPRGTVVVVVLERLGNATLNKTPQWAKVWAQAHLERAGVIQVVEAQELFVGREGFLEYG
jgi:hypothetical protein